MSWFATSDSTALAASFFYFKGSAASGFTLASGSRDTALTIRLTHATHIFNFLLTAEIFLILPDHRITRCPDHPIKLGWAARIRT
jgi:hypothetical protein